MQGTLQCSINGAERIFLLDKLELLYEYMQSDAKLEAYEKELKNTETRTQLVKLQNYLMKQQSILKDMENKAMVEQNDLSEINAQHEKITSILGQKHKDISEYEKLSLDELDLNVVKNLVNEYETTYENIVKQKRRAVSIEKKAEETEKALKEILSHVSKVQKDFALLKKRHEDELHAGAGELDKLKKELEAASKKVDPELLKKYNRIKKNRPLPVALLSDGRCMGCNMDLPSSVLAKIKKGSSVVECENCGRILYLK